jgi:nicotinate-nucleotide--dimethylbenzimidazole phosphoribosyltransferase
MTKENQSAPFDDIRQLIQALPGLDRDAAATASQLRQNLSGPPGGLGRLGSLFDWLAGASGRCPPTFRSPRLALYAARHGAADEDPMSISAEHVRRHLELLAAGGGIANALCSNGDVGLQVFDLAPEVASGDPAQGPSLSPRDCAATIAFGMEALAGDVDLLCLGDISAGAEFGAVAILDPMGMPLRWNAHRQAAIDDPLEALSRLGGRETAALVGAICAAGHQRIPVLLDGWAALAAASVMWRLNPQAIAHCQLAQARGPAQQKFAEALGFVPLMDFDLRAGEGAAAALCVPLLRTAVSVHLALPKAGGDPPPAHH